MFLCVHLTAEFHFLKQLCADLTWLPQMCQNRKTISSDWLGAHATRVTCLNQSLLQCKAVFVYKSLCMLAHAKPNAQSTLRWKNVKTQQSSAILNLNLWMPQPGKTHDYRPKTLDFRRFSAHTKTKSRRFLIPPVWRAFSKSSVFVTDLCGR